MSVSPNTFIIGSAKCGTTTLSKILSNHPECCFSKPKEPQFFNSEKNYKLGLEWYSSCWAHYNEEAVVAEATPRYTRRDLYPDVASRIKNFSTDCKLIHIARNPYEKFVSFWRMGARLALKKKESFPDINEFFQTSPRIPEILSSCKYEYQLQPFFEVFKADQFHLMTMEDLRDCPDQEITKLFDFLGIDNSNVSKYSKTKANSAELDLPSLLTLPFSMLSNGMSVIKTKIARQDLTPDLKTSFFDEVRADALAHLKRLGKSDLFWKLEP